MDYFNYSTNFNNYYTLRENSPWILDYTNNSIQYNLNTAITMIKNSINDEVQDTEMYEALINSAPNDEEKELIKDIQNDEKIHNKLLREVFTKITGVVLPPNLENGVYPKITYIDGIKKAFIGELKAVEKYREILNYMPSMELYNKILYIMTDKMKHAIKYNYLLTKYLNKN